MLALIEKITASRLLGIFLILLLCIVTIFISIGWIKLERNQITIASSEADLSLPKFYDAKITAGWTPNRDKDIYNVFQYSKGSDSKVTLRGLMDGCPKVVGQPIFTLPVGYRPKKREVFLVITGINSLSNVRVDVAPSGAVLYFGPGCHKGEFLSLSGVSFYTDEQSN